ncbi:hypothetical protein [Peristeroidobacter soli]|uniref:hypothetical protein n=1 Tax=Peristeroidobacter soli TaxID=2497877 RepID=UPI0015895769|nr:hypothetical protein [Peristeroidobacter soli]
MNVSFAAPPTFRAAQAAGPILQQLAGLHQSQIELFDALRTAGKPTQITFYRGETSTSQETHIFHIPSNRLAAMRIWTGSISGCWAGKMRMPPGPSSIGAGVGCMNHSPDEALLDAGGSAAGVSCSFNALSYRDRVGGSNEGSRAQFI